MERSPDVEQLKNLGQLERLGKGIDSIVYKLKTQNSEMAVKDYTRFVARFGEGLAKETLVSYYADTERAQSLIENNSNPLNQKITVNGKEYDLNYIIVPQGGLMLEGEELNYLNGDPSDKVPIVASQSVIPAKNLGRLLEGDYEDDWKTNNQMEFYEDDDLVTDFEDRFANLVKYLNSELNVNFTESIANIKPFLDDKNNKIDIYITDLASSLADYFMQSPNMEKIREKYSDIVDSVNKTRPENKK